MKSIARKAEFGEQGKTSVCDRLMGDLRRKAELGEIDYMVVYAEVDDRTASLGLVNVVRTTYVTGAEGYSDEEHSTENIGDVVPEQSVIVHL